MKNIDMIQFFWDRDQSGYEWSYPPKDDSDSSKGPHLNAKCFTHPGKLSIEYYSPLEIPGLFRTFAATEPTEQGVMQFALQYGQLGGADEHITTWQRQIKLMSRAVRIWDLVQNRDSVQLNFMIEWEGNSVYLREEKDTLIASQETGQMHRFKKNDVYKPALFYLQVLINRQLEKQASSALLWDESGANLGLAIIPSSLIGALWLQLARTIDGNIAYQSCEAGCGHWIAIQPGKARKDKKYCSHACRQKAYRALKTVGKVKENSQRKEVKGSEKIKQKKQVKKHENPRQSRVS
jgi:hypothetical protein